jgi:NADH dehydrogenase (ubiquinone) 1 alpha subcomplex subunit 6
MAIYDIVSMGEENLKRKIRSHFYAHAHVKDERVITVLLEKGYIDLEETLLQYKQKNHLLLLLESVVGTHQNIKALGENASIDEQFMRIG